MTRLGLLVIGDEILAGHTQDTNTRWLAKRCKQAGIELVRVEVCSDMLDDIATSTLRFLTDLPVDEVITSGGLGPTHDDRTMEGIAQALDLRLELTDANRDWMNARVAEGHRRGYFESAQPNAGHMKMALLPEGAGAMPNALGTCLGAIINHNGRRLWTLPGVPREFERMFTEEVLPHLEQSTPDTVEELIIYSEESRFFEIMRQLESDHQVAIGSYPQKGHLIVRATGTPAASRAAIDAMRKAAAAFLEPCY